MADSVGPSADFGAGQNVPPPLSPAGNRRVHSYRTSLTWTGDRGSGTSGYAHYGRDHELAASGKPPILASADPTFRGDPTRYNPEELLVCSLSACHMLWYLHLCADAGIVVTDYRDEAVGVMVEVAGEGGSFREVVLAPRVTIVAGGDLLLAGRLHDRAHDLCFVANSVKFPVRCLPEIGHEVR